MSDYPSELSHRWKTQDGTEILIRPIRPEDAGIEKDFIHQLSPKSKYFRFFSGLMDLSPAMLERFTRIDYAHEMALIAVHVQDGKEVEIGHPRSVALDDGPIFAAIPGRIDLDTRASKTDRARCRVQLNIPVPHPGQGRRHFRPVRQMARPLVEPPNLHKRAHCDIERTFALPAVFDTGRKKLEKLR